MFSAFSLFHRNFFFPTPKKLDSMENLKKSNRTSYQMTFSFSRFSQTLVVFSINFQIFFSKHTLSMTKKLKRKKNKRTILRLKNVNAATKQRLKKRENAKRAITQIQYQWFSVNMPLAWSRICPAVCSGYSESLLG